MAQRQFRSDDTDTWGDKYGNGSDGAYAPSTSTDAPIDSACTGTISTTSLSATNASFAGGQLILIHQTRGTGAGQWELNKITSYTAGTITTAYPLIFGYVSGAQVLVMPSYSSGSIAGGVTVTAKAWDGSTGGIYAKFVNGTFANAGSIAGTAKGFRGGNGTSGADTGGVQGEGTAGAGAANDAAANGNGGGGVLASGTLDAGTGAGGGGNGGTGGAGGAGQQGGPGTGGTAVGDTELISMNLGGGGGEGGAGRNGANNGGAGGGGGAIILVIAKTITLTGTVVIDGSAGASASANSAGGGGGAGGAALFKGQIVTLGTALAQAAGASGGNGGTGAGGAGSASGSGSAGAAGGSNGAGGGGGACGRIHVDYANTLSGTTSPTVNSRLDTSLQDTTGGFLTNLL